VSASFDVGVSSHNTVFCDTALNKKKFRQQSENLVNTFGVMFAQNNN